MSTEIGADGSSKGRRRRRRRGRGRGIGQSIDWQNLAEFTWSRYTTPEHPNAAKPFARTSSPLDIARQQQSPLDYFYPIIGLPMFHLITEKSSWYAQQKGK